MAGAEWPPAGAVAPDEAGKAPTWTASASWVDDTEGENQYHSAWGHSRPPSLSMDIDTSTHAAFLGTSGFMVMDLGTVSTVTQMRIRNDQDAACPKNVELHSAKSISGPWKSQTKMSLTNSLGWQESLPVHEAASLFCLSWYDNHGYSAGTRIVDVELMLQAPTWTASASWVDDTEGANQYHSAWGHSRPPSLSMDTDTSTHAAFLGTSGFMVMDLGTVSTVTQMRIRNDQDAACPKNVELHSAKSISGPWKSQTKMSLTNSLGWQESLPFHEAASLFCLSWYDNHGYSAGTRIVDVELMLQARADAKDQELKTLASQSGDAMREVSAKCDSAIKELEAMSAKYESTSKELKTMSTKYDSARKELEAVSAKHDSVSKELEAMSAKYDSASKELERIAAAGQPASARGSALAAARAGHGAEERLAALEAVLDELQVDAGMLKDGASFRRWMAQQGFVKEQKFEARALKFGRSTEAAAGIEALIGIDEDDLHDRARGGLAAMRAEFEANGGPEDKANFKYVVEGVAQDKQWLPDHVKADIQKGQYHGGRLEPDDYDRNHSGMTLKDFAASLEAKVSKLKEHHVAALRLYTTSSFRKLNAPFRDRSPLPHPFAVTVFFLAQGLKKLRTVQAEIDPEGFAAESTLWRGLSNATIDLEAFKREGGTELAPMSTSTDRSVAAKYAASQSPLILRYKAKGLTKGVSLKFLSVYPKEEEILYPPGTFLSFGGVEEIDGVTVVTVEPQMA